MMLTQQLREYVAACFTGLWIYQRRDGGGQKRRRKVSLDPSNN